MTATHLQAHCQSRKIRLADKSFVKELVKPTQDKIVFKKFPDPSKKNRNAPPNTDRQKSEQTMTGKTQPYNDFQTRWTRTPAANSVLPQLAVTCKIEDECYINLLCRLTVKCFEIAKCGNPQTVTGNAKDDTQIRNGKKKIEFQYQTI